MKVQPPNAERQIWIYTQMLRIREFEESVKRSFTEHPGVIRGHTHLADGAEASIVGSLSALPRGRCGARDLPLPRLPAGARERSEGDDGRDLRSCRRPVQGPRRIDAPDRRQARLPRHLRHRRRRHPARRRRGLGRADPQERRGRALLLRRRRLQAGRLPRDAQHRLAVEAAGGLRDGEQRLQRRHHHRAGGRQRRRRRAARDQGQGLRDAGRHRRWRRPAGGSPTVVGEADRARARAAMGRRWSSRRSTACPRTATSSRRPACRCITPSTRRSPCSASARSTRRRCAAIRCRASAARWSTAAC